MPATVLLITPPFTQLNTPYPATAYLKGFLNTRNISSFQSDLGIEVILKLFSREGMQKLFAYVQEREQLFSPEAARILSLRHQYIHTIDAVIRFLQGRDPGLAQRICRRPWLPEGARFVQLNEELDHAFGIMGLQDKAKHLATMYLEDLADFIKETADKHFGFSRYAERLGRSAATFDALHESLQLAPTFTDEIMLPLLQQHIAQTQPKLVAFSVPFPGNLYAAFRCAQWIRKNHPEIRIAMGGGFANTELRSVSDARVFEYVHFITLDDGEAPVEALVHHVAGNLP